MDGGLPDQAVRGNFEAVMAVAGTGTDLARALVAQVERVIVGKRKAVELAVIGLLSNGHVLIEDIPGVGKTTLAKALAKSLGISFSRIQFTPDLLPSDITGTNVYNQKSGEFEFRPGPVFNSIVLADEVNRGTPKTQASLLECMEEFQVTVDGKTRAVPQPFFVMATENPIEYHGTYPLPEAQLDRFLLKIDIGYPAPAEEVTILQMQMHHHPLEDIDAVVSGDEIRALKQAVRQVYVDDTVKHYIVDIVNRTRRHQAAQLGASPRGSLGLLRTGQARALMEGRNFVVPDDVKFVAKPVLAHRIMVGVEQRMSGADAAQVVAEILDSVAVPISKRPRLA